ncbi:hypothetical protein HW877_09400 [Serratia marcescens]|uniref:hypothetical protein n=1 Tax=Serratia marcescens TaxID=615 RepID=UPI001FD3B334|nr:hypothetical protein [Serratia marcescens]UOO25860.1 hypothetical protein HW877_09400 [Serratia marcescens]HBB9121083.1 hypothetical protein [Serratia marcescens]
MKQNLIDALEGIRGGADIYNRFLAMQLRDVQKNHPEYITICEPQAYRGDGSDQVPFFGAITTKAGNDYLDEVNKFDSMQARSAQDKYCKENNAPHFAPNNGICFRCKRDIYLKIDNGIFITGISVRRAGSELVTGCPHCNRSYCD